MQRIRNIALILTCLCAAAAQADLYEDLANYSYGDETNAPQKLDDLVKATDPGKYAPIEAKLIKIIESKNATQDGKAWTCRMLQRIGTTKCIPALGGLLHDPVLSHYARLTLERMEGEPRAAEALRKALPRAPDSVKAGLATSLGKHRDAASVDELAKLVKHSDPNISKAALRALGMIGNQKASDVLFNARVTEECERAKMEATIACAKAQGDTELLTAISMTHEDNVARVVALRALLETEPSDTAVLFEVLDEADEELRSGVLQVLATVGGSEVTKSAVMNLKRRTDRLHLAAIITALGERGDENAAGFLMQHLDHPQKAVQQAAFDAIKNLSGVDAVEKLLSIAGGESASTLAFDTLARMSADGGIDQKLIDLLDDANYAAPAMKVLAMRGNVEAAPHLVKAVDSKNDAVRAGAWQALPQVASAEHVDALMKAMLAIEDPKEQGQARAAIRAICARAIDRETCFKRIAPFYDKVDDETKLFILELGPVAGTGEALAIERQALQGDNAELRKQAVRSLAAWPNPAPLDNLLAVAADPQTKTEGILALRGYIEIAGQHGNHDQKAERLTKAVKLASQEAEKRLIISKLRDMHNIDSLRLITLFMDDKSLQNEAHDAIINVLTRSRRDRGKYTNEKIAIVQKVIDTSEDKRNVNRAKTELEELQKK